MKLTDHKKRTLRVILVGSIFAILYIAISARAVHLHIFKGPWLSQKAECEYKKSFTCLGKRGTIFDTNHKEMAVSVNATSIAANPSRIKNPRAAAKNLARILDLNPRKLRRKLSSGRTFVWIKRQVIPKKVSAVKNLELEGIAFLPAYVRVYPNLTAAAQVIGFSGIDGQGLEGLEFYYNFMENEYFSRVSSLQIANRSLHLGLWLTDHGFINYFCFKTNGPGDQL